PPVAHAVAALVVIGVTTCASGIRTGPPVGLPLTVGGGPTIGAPAAGAGKSGGTGSAAGKVGTLAEDVRCGPTTVPPGRGVGTGGSTGGGGNDGDWAHAAVPVNRAVLESHRRNPHMVCLAAVDGRRPARAVGSSSPKSAARVANLNGRNGPAGRASMSG